MLILGIESSCDETGVALVRTCESTVWPQLLAQHLHTQAAMHEAYGGVVPELASRDHIRRLVPLVEQVMASAQPSLSDIDVVAYTRGPGWQALCWFVRPLLALWLPAWATCMGIHHLEGHLLSPFLSDDPPQFPFVALLVSGGHTQLMWVKALGQYELLGETIDDAAGEAFDKSAKLLGLGYPGGPALAALANQGRADAYAFPRPLLHQPNLDFSFAGLKTAVLTQCKKSADQLPQHRADIAASTQAAIVEVLVKKSLRALTQTGISRLVVAGGVGANRALRTQLTTSVQRMGATVHFPDAEWCTDNGAMIAMAAGMRLQQGIEQAHTSYAFDVLPRWPLAQI
jgi:N6-L-threonylcarbamoyladenine synthase